jgi:hypothetical protein
MPNAPAVRALLQLELSSPLDPACRALAARRARRCSAQAAAALEPAGPPAGAHHRSMMATGRPPSARPQRPAVSSRSVSLRSRKFRGRRISGRGPSIAWLRAARGVGRAGPLIRPSSCSRAALQGAARPLGRSLAGSVPQDRPPDAPAGLEVRLQEHIEGTRQLCRRHILPRGQHVARAAARRLPAARMQRGLRRLCLLCGRHAARVGGWAARW